MDEFILIRKAEYSDLKQISKVHSICFPDSFSTALGISNLMRFYELYIQKVGDYFLVAKNKSGIVGFCMGYKLESNTFVREFVKFNKLRIFVRSIFLLLCLDKRIVKKILDFFFEKKHKELVVNREYIVIPYSECINILSICVLPEYRGSGLAKNLIIKFENQAKIANRKMVTLTVRQKNERGIAFYIKNGYTIFKECGQSIRMGKLI